ncbi:hypothetical protein DAPK24_031970 [Pichia kluyveri]|mgnify:FL=1|uniref:Uncharacterized protein n=1 Tax=Pichia kluyveri TaxID=36015 RepID=A0AAV5R5M4_PICKL|nr:hypothetical protein DAPK24_031970 [Pichia kluyveri]
MRALRNTTNIRKDLLQCVNCTNNINPDYNDDRIFNKIIRNNDNNSNTNSYILHYNNLSQANIDRMKNYLGRTPSMNNTFHFIR